MLTFEKHIVKLNIKERQIDKAILELDVEEAILGFRRGKVFLSLS